MIRDLEALADAFEAIDHGAHGISRLGAIPYVSSDWLSVLMKLTRAQTSSTYEGPS